MSTLRLLSFKTSSHTSFGVAVDGGVIDLQARLKGKYDSLLALIQAGAGDEARAHLKSAPDYRFSEIEFLPPVAHPEKILCVGINYPERNEEYKDGREKPKYPNLFVRFPGSLVGHEHPVLRPKVSDKFDYEGEIVIVIGRKGRNVALADAGSMIFGLTLGNEGTVRDWLRHGTLNVTQGKNFDSSGSVGPWIVPSADLDPLQSLHLMTRINGALRQDDKTGRLSWGFTWLIEYITKFTTLVPGDLIFTGTPVGAGGHQVPPQWLKPGDVVEVEVPEIGVLRNTVHDDI